MDEKMLARIADMLDKQDIRECLTRFSRGMDRLDREIYMSAFWPDGTMAAGPFVGAPAECWDWASAMHRDWQIATHHDLLNTTIEIDGDTAHSETYYMFVARNNDESVWLAGGRYVDRLEKRGDEWKIALRTNAIEWSVNPPEMPLPFGDVPDIQGNGPIARDHSDISYRRPLTNLRQRNIPA